jgi:hypothetical protein
MFIDRFTFNTNVTEDGRGSTVAIPNYENPKDKMYPNFIFKKRLSYEFKIEKMFGIVKKYVGFGDWRSQGFSSKFTAIGSAQTG